MSVDDKQQNNSAVISEKRRKLLKASAAAPLVATVTFGNGQAAANSAYQCMDAANNPQPPTAGDDIPHTGVSPDELANLYDKHSGTDGVNRMLVGKYVHNPVVQPPNSDPALDLYKLNDGIYYKADGTNLGNNPDLSNYDSPIDVDVSMFYTPSGDLLSVTENGPWPKATSGRPLFDSCVDSIIVVDNNSFSKNIV